MRERGGRDHPASRVLRRWNLHVVDRVHEAFAVGSQRRVLHDEFAVRYTRKNAVTRSGARTPDAARSEAGDAPAPPLVLLLAVNVVVASRVVSSRLCQPILHVLFFIRLLLALVCLLTVVLCLCFLPHILV